MKRPMPLNAWEINFAPPAGDRAPPVPFTRGAPSGAVWIEPMALALAKDTTDSLSGTASRRRIWDLHASLHCSIIGTCLTAGDLRALVRKFGAAASASPDDHELHTIAVSAAGRRDQLARQMQKALDRRHKIAINHFAKAKHASDVRRIWEEARQAGEIPGAYWAALTHPQANDAVIKHIFGDVHMLSHLVGAANRADIRRLRQLEEEKAGLEEKLNRQQAQLRDGIVARDRKIRELGTALSTRIAKDSVGVPPTETDRASELVMLHALVADLRKLLDGEVRRRERAEALAAARAKDEHARLRAEGELAALRCELEAAESRLGAIFDRGSEGVDDLDLTGLTILYVGGKPHQVARLRSLVAQASGDFIHHDGGIEERSELLPGLVSRATAAFFPVDCISHRAALLLKRLCQQAGKPYVPLRSAGVASMIRALRAYDLGPTALPDNAAE